jgi:hypothetical protein
MSRFGAGAGVDGSGDATSATTRGGFSTTAAFLAAGLVSRGGRSPFNGTGGGGGSMMRGGSETSATGGAGSFGVRAAAVRVGKAVLL